MSPSKKIVKFFFVLAIMSVSYSFTSLYVLYSRNSSVLPDFWHGAMDAISPTNTSCYYMYKDASNIYLDFINNAPKANNSIYFHEITCQTTLAPREACCVESIARANPNRQVNVIFTRALTERDCVVGTLAELKKLRNVHFYTVDLNIYADETPLRDVFKSHDTSLGKWHYRGIGQLLKFVTLYKFGGVAVDFNLMVVDSVDKLGENWATLDNWGAGIISMALDSRGEYYSKWFMTNLRHQLARDEAVNKDSAIKKVITSLCDTEVLDEMTPRKCKGFRVYTKEFFNPGNTSSEDFTATDTNPYLGYWWKETSDHQLSSSYDRLAKEHCPFVFNGLHDSTNDLTVRL